MWSPFYLAAQESLVSRSGLFGFFHDYLREAVRETYLPTETHEKAVHRRLADYFKRTLPDSREEYLSRVVDELPWQLAEAGEWKRLYDLLADLPFFSAAWDANEFEVKSYWSQIENGSPLRMIDAYRPILEAPRRQYATDVWDVATLLADTGYLMEALFLRKYLVEYHRQSGNRGSLQAALGNLAMILQIRGDLNEAMTLLKEKEHICCELEDLEGRQSALGNQANILKVRGDFDGAMVLLKEVDRICRKSGNKLGLQRSLGNQAVILHDRCDLDGAMALHQEVDRICHEIGSRDVLAVSLCNQGCILLDRDDLDGAMTLFKEAEHICRDIGDKRGLQVCLGQRAHILRSRGDLDGAMALHQDVERGCREIGNKDVLAMSLNNQAMILLDRGDAEGAMALLKECETVCGDLGNKDILQECLVDQAMILKEGGHPDEAITLLKEAERICRELNDPKALAGSLAQQALVLVDMEGRPGDALPLAEEAYQLAVNHGLTRLARATEGTLDFIRQRFNSVQQSALGERTETPTKYSALYHAHPSADPERAFRLNRQYQEELARWKALPLWKRLTVKKPAPAEEI